MGVNAAPIAVHRGLRPKMAAGENHHALHSKGSAVLQAIRDGNKHEAEAGYRQEETLSKSIVSALAELGRLSEEMKTKQQSILYRTHRSTLDSRAARS
jgi:hypothetical protein